MASSEPSAGHRCQPWAQPLGGENVGMVTQQKCHAGAWGYVGRGSCALHLVDLLAMTCPGPAKLVLETHGLGLKGPLALQPTETPSKAVWLWCMHCFSWAGWESGDKWFVGWAVAALGQPAQHRGTGDLGWAPGPQAGCCPVLGGLWLGMLSCPASGTGASPWEGQALATSGGSEGERSSAVYVLLSCLDFCLWLSFDFCVLYDFPVTTHASWLSLQQCLFLAGKANLKASSWALYCVSSSDDVCVFPLITPIFK